METGPRETGALFVSGGLWLEVMGRGVCGFGSEAWAEGWLWLVGWGYGLLVFGWLAGRRWPEARGIEA